MLMAGVLRFILPCFVLFVIAVCPIHAAETTEAKVDIGKVTGDRNLFVQQVATDVLQVPESYLAIELRIGEHEIEAVPGLPNRR